MAPIANPDTATTTYQTAIVIDVMANDDDVEGNALSFNEMANPQNGVVVINHDKTLTYTPRTGFHGDDIFSYSIRDGATNSRPVTVRIHVLPAPPRIDEIKTAPNSGPNGEVTLTFNQPVKGFEVGDLELRRNGGDNLLNGVHSVTLTTADGLTWTVGNLQSVTVQSGTYTLTLVANNSGITDLEGQPLTGGTPYSYSWEQLSSYTVTLLGNSDTALSIPFTRPPAATTTVLSFSGNTVHVSGTPNWTASQWVYAAGVQTNTYYLYIRSGSLEGAHYTIVANDPDSLTLDLKGASLTGLSPGDSLSIIPHWTLGTIFPDGAGVHASFSPLSRATEVLMPNVGGTGINLSAAAIYYFWNGAWRQVGRGTAVKDHEVVPPDMFMWVRHNISTPTQLTTYGNLIESTWRIPITRMASGKQDNLVAFPGPVSVSLNASGLIESGAFRASLSPLNRMDELIIFDNTTAGKNKSAVGIYYYWNGAWHKVGFGATDVGDDLVFQPGTGVIILCGSGDTSIAWSINLPD